MNKTGNVCFTLLLGQLSLSMDLKWPLSISHHNVLKFILFKLDTKTSKSYVHKYQVLQYSVLWSHSFQYEVLRVMTISKKAAQLLV